MTFRCETCGQFMPIERGYPPIEETRCEECAALDPRVWDEDRRTFVRRSDYERRRRAAMIQELAP